MADAGPLDVVLRAPGDGDPAVGIDEAVEATVERLAYGGDGVARVDGFVVFVPWTAPGDRVRATVRERRPGYARARLEAVVESGPDRVRPGCPVFGVCGGCRLQHLSAVAQRRSKARAVEDAFRRIARRPLEPPPACEEAAAPWHYRRRATFTWRRTADGLVLGFHAVEAPLPDAPPPAAPGPDPLVDVTACPILAEPGNLAIAPLRAGLEAALAADDAGAGEGRIEVQVLPGGEVRLGAFAIDEETARRVAGACARTTGVPTTWGGWSQRLGARLAAGAPRLEATFAYRGLNLRAGFDSFLQADLEAAEAVYDAVLEGLDAGPGDRVVDGYAGIGVVTCHLIAAGAAVTAIEAHSGAASDLRANAARAAGGGRTHVLELPADRVDWARPRPDAIVVNPPRGGLPRSTIASIGRSPARRLVYVSCDPTTLARDVRRLGKAWRVAGARVFDLFPQTAHVETVVRLERGGGR